MTRALLAALALALLLAGVQTWRIDRVKADLVKARIEIATLQEFRRVAVDDAQTQADQCQARVNEARQSARRIETIIEREVPNDANGCPLRPRLTGDELRQTLQPDAPAPKPVR